jgi:putative acetyltransferase
MVDLYCIRTPDGKIAGFSGVKGSRIEMLFIHPEVLGRGIGKRLLNHAVQHLNKDEVDVNEQNEQALGFYLHAGFSVVRRSEKDALGMPYPILHMKILKPV